MTEARTSFLTETTEDVAPAVKHPSVPEINAILEIELQMIREQMTAEKALEIVRESLDRRIEALRRDSKLGFKLDVEVPMMW